MSHLRPRRRRLIPVELDRLRWVAVVAPVAFILIIEGLRHLMIPQSPEQESAHLALAGMLIVGAVTFALVMFLGIEATQRQLIRQNRELAAVNAVSTAVQGELGLDAIIDAALDSVIHSTGATEASVAVFSGDDTPGGAGYERRKVASSHVSATAAGELPHLIDIPLSVGTTVLGRMLLHLPAGVEEPDLLASATLSNIGHQLAAAIQIRQLVLGLQRRQHEDHRLYEILLQVSNQTALAETLAAVVRDARELLAADEAVLCLSELGSRAVQFDGPGTPPPGVAAGPSCIHTGADAFAPAHDRRQACPLRASVGDGPTFEVPVRGPEATAYGVLWLGRASGQEFTETNRRFLTVLSDLVSIAITSARMRENERQGAAVAERERIAREMHDSLAQVLGVTHLRLRALAARPEVTAVPTVATEIGDLASISEEAYRDVREAILGLREATSVDRDLTETIRAYLERYSHQAGITASLDNQLDREPALPPRVEVQLIRVIQEALTNVRKHGAASRVVVRLLDAPGGVRIEIEDDGRGFDIGRTLLGRDGFGLHTMRERMDLVGGTLSVDSTPGKGTTVVAIVPGASTPSAVSNTAATTTTTTTTTR